MKARDRTQLAPLTAAWSAPQVIRLFKLAAFPTLCCPEQFSTRMIMSEKHARDKPRRVNMQARAASV